jgi:hypothetical protein
LGNAYITPPSAIMVYPVIYEEASLAKKSATSAISYRFPSLYKGMYSAYLLKSSLPPPFYYFP